MEMWWEHYATFPQLAICYFAIAQCVRTGGGATVGLM